MATPEHIEYSDESNVKYNNNINTSLGYLKLYIGPMFSGKSTALTDEYKYWTHNNMRTIAINYHKDHRYSDGNYIVTHDKKKIPSIKIADLNNVDVSLYDVILIDEGQFFPDITPVIEWVDTHKKCVIVSGLSGDFKRKKFGKNIDLVHICDDCVIKHGLCSTVGCSNKSLFTWKHTGDISTNAEDIGGVDKYVPVCRSCYVNLSQERQNKCKRSDITIAPKCCSSESSPIKVCNLIDYM